MTNIQRIVPSPYINVISNKSRNSFLTSVQAASLTLKVIRCNEWQMRLRNKSHIGIVNLQENLAKGYDRPWTTWRCLNRLRTGYAYSKEQRKKWNYYDGDTTCECGLAKESAARMMRCNLLAHPCTLDDLIMFNDRGKHLMTR